MRLLVNLVMVPPPATLGQQLMLTTREQQLDMGTSPLGAVQRPHVDITRMDDEGLGQEGLPK